MRLLPVALLFAACTDPSDVGDSGAEALYEGPVVVWELVLKDAQQDGVEGAEACSRAGCFVSDATGAVSIDLPVGEGTLTLEHPDMVPRLYSMTIDDRPPSESTVTLFSWEVLEALFGPEDLIIDPNKAHLLGQVIYGEGTTVSLEPSSGDGPFYAGESGLGVDADRTSAGPGFAGFSFFNVDGTGSVEVAFDGVPEGCEGTVYSQMTTPGTHTTVELRAGFASTTEIRCPEVAR